MSGDRNIVMVTVDSLRADHCGFMGYDRETTPTLDEWAADGVVFENAIAPGPRTPSSMPTVFTGRFGPVSPIEEWEYSHRQARISEHLARHRTIAERLREVGYSTIGLTTNPWTSDFHFETSFAKGFDRFTDLITANKSVDVHTSTPWIAAVDRVLGETRLGRRLHWQHVKDWFLQWPQYYEYLFEELSHAEEPYFLWVFVLDTHQPYITPPEYRVENSWPGMYYPLLWDYFSDPRDARYPRHVQTLFRRSYRDTIRSVDRFLHTLFEDLRDDDPVFLVHSDHGEAFGEHGTYGHLPELYQENLHVPLLVRNADAAPRRVSKPVSLQSILPMLSALAADDRSFDPDEYTADFVPATTEDGEKAALCGQRWKYLADGDDEELYDLDADAAERTNVADEFPDVVDSMRSILARYRAGHAEELGISQSIEAVRPDL